MANFTFNVKKGNKKHVDNHGANPMPVKPKQIKVELTKHDAVKHEPEYYSYINEAGESCKFSGIITTDIDGTYVGKVIKTHKVILDYHPKVEAVEHVDEYFSYIDNNGNEKVFIGQPEFNLEENTYFGIVTEDILNDEVITIFKEDK
ncbi:MAG: hypothetical protein IJH39_12335 [Clostridia bacterium]|nr:hypothetical protein [Clostridia bacterium]